MAGTFLFYDFETDGAEPQFCRPTQFAYIRTDLDLNPVAGPDGEGLVLWCKPPRDRLPAPEAVLITGITPQHAEHEGCTERDFFGKIHALVNTPGTTSLGWNSLRFDDTVCRFGFWRTFHDPYTHGWSHGCRTWDLIDVARACYALRPKGIVWPAYVDDEWEHDRLPLAPGDGSPAFKLDMLAPANGIEHADAHDALADVRATVAFARIMRAANPKLWNLALDMTDKRTVEKLLKSGKPLLHVSPKIPNAVGCASLVQVVAQHPVNKREFIAWDLRHDPTDLIEASAETIQARTFVKKDELPEGVERFALKGIKSNRAPIVIAADKALMDSIDTDRIALDLDACRRHWSQLVGAKDQLAQTVSQAWNRKYEPRSRDVDDMLYDGFLEDVDRDACDDVRAAPPEALAAIASRFADDRLPDLLLHYRARNFPDSLDESERHRWHARCDARLEDPPGRDDLPIAEWFAHLAAVQEDPTRTDEQRRLLARTADWGRALQPNG
jgi:exodeoxyribonuclease-1